MKKNILKAILLAVVAAPLFTACELDQYPTSSIPNEESWEKFSDVANFNVGVRSMFRGSCCVGWYDTDLQADYYQPGTGYGNNGGTTYNWSFDSRAMEGLWSSMYSVIMQTNNFLNNCDRIELKAEDYDSEEAYNIDVARLSQFKAEAYFTRAFAYLNTAIRYCKDYEPETADTELGLPLVTEVDINAKPARATLAATFNFIKADLAKARELCKVEELRALRSEDFEITPDMIDFVEARCDLYMHNFDEAITLAKALIDNPDYELAADADNLTQQLTTDVGSEFVYVAFADRTEGYVNYSTYYAWNNTEEVYSPYFLLAQSTLDAYDDADIRKSVFFVEADHPVKQMQEKADGIFLLNKFPAGNDAYNTSSDDPEHTYKHAKKPFRIAEMYLVAAEAAYRNGDDLAAQEYLSGLTEARGLGATQLIGEPLFQLIKMEWFREFIGEGQRLDGLKRWHEGFTRSGETQADNIIMRADPSRNIELSVDANDPRFVWEIPYNDQLANPNIEKNWNF